MEVLIVFFSWKGSTRKVALALAESLKAKASVTVEEIRPLRSRTYIEWLLLSAIPTSKVKIGPMTADPSQYDLVFLGFPKWTLGCPPVNRYFQTISDFAGGKVVPFMTYGGFDHLRYMGMMASSLRKKNANVVDTLAISRKSVKNGTYLEVVSSFLERDMKFHLLD